MSSIDKLLSTSARWAKERVTSKDDMRSGRPFRFERAKREMQANKIKRWNDQKQQGDANRTGESCGRDGEKCRMRVRRKEKGKKKAKRQNNIPSRDWQRRADAHETERQQIQMAWLHT